MASAYRRVDLWVPQLGGAGGIQQYSRNLLRALEEELPEAEIRVFSKLDCPEIFPVEDKVTYHTSGGIPKSARAFRFVLMLLAQTLRRPPDLAILTHLHFAPLALALQKMMGLRYWVAAHGIEAWAPLSLVTRRALAASERILPVSTVTRDRLLASSRLSPVQCSVLPNAVDGDAFYPEPKPVHLLRRYGLTNKHKILLTLARLTASDRYKGYDRVVDLLPLLRGVVPEIHYLLSGRGPENERIRRKVQCLGLEKQVTLTGFVPDQEVRDHYNLCDVFVMPSEGEGFGLVYLEALACGRQVVAGSGDGARGPLLDGNLGDLIDVRDSRALRDAVVRSLGRSANDFGADLRQRVLAEFGCKQLNRRLRDLLEA